MNTVITVDTCWDASLLKNWRLKQGLTLLEAGERLGLPYKTLSRYESGYVPPINKAHRIVSGTRGAVRYRDIYLSFHPRYA